ncbi:hypothetical protein [Spirosoma jeollabukense]
MRSCLLSKPFIRPLIYGPLHLVLLACLSQCKQPSIPVPANTTPTRDDNIARENPDGA